MPEYKVIGRDAYGNFVTQSVQIFIEPGWKRILRRIGRWFGIGRPRRISSIKMDDDYYSDTTWKM